MLFVASKLDSTKCWCSNFSLLKHIFCHKFTPNY